MSQTLEERMNDLIHQTITLPDGWIASSNQLPRSGWSHQSSQNLRNILQRSPHYHGLVQLIDWGVVCEEEAYDCFRANYAWLNHRKVRIDEWIRMLTAEYEAKLASMVVS